MPHEPLRPRGAGTREEATVAAFVFRLLPPRPTFPADATADEREVMAAHAIYWRELMGRGNVVGFGPVDEPAGTYGIAIVTADDLTQARSFADADPAVRSGRGFRTEIAPMLALITPGTPAS
jgi:uncharacterized protein